MDALLCVLPGTKQVQIRTELFDKEILMVSPIIHRRWLSAVIGLSVYPKLIDALLIEKILDWSSWNSPHVQKYFPIE